MPAVPGSIYYVSSYVSSFTTTSAYNTGTDYGGGTTTVVTIDNESPAVPTSASGEVTSSKNVLIRFTNPSTQASSTLALRSTTQVVDAPVEGQTYSVGNVVGASVVACVNTSLTLGAQATCTDSTASRATNYYYKVFSKDSAGNYSSTGATVTGAPFKIKFESASIYFEEEVQNGGTTTISGGGQGGGGGDSGTTTNATTTTGGGGSQGGGGGDSGFLYHGSNIALLFKRALGSLFVSGVTGNSQEVSARNSSSHEEGGCSLKVFGVCLIKSQKVVNVQQKIK
jgi:hypothetical protein